MYSDNIVYTQIEQFQNDYKLLYITYIANIYYHLNYIYIGDKHNIHFI